MQNDKNALSQPQAGGTLSDAEIIEAFYMHTVEDDEPLFTFDRKGALALARAILSKAKGEQA